MASVAGSPKASVGIGGRQIFLAIAALLFAADLVLIFLYAIKFRHSLRWKFIKRFVMRGSIRRP